MVLMLNNFAKGWFSNWRLVWYFRVKNPGQREPHWATRDESQARQIRSPTAAQVYNTRRPNKKLPRTTKHDVRTEKTLNSCSKSRTGSGTCVSDHLPSLFETKHSQNAPGVIKNYATHSSAVRSLLDGADAIPMGLNWCGRINCVLNHVITP